MFKIRFMHVSYSKNRDWKPFISQILTNVQEIFLVMWMLTVPTPLDHIYVHATLGTLEMDRLAQVILISFLQCPERSFMTNERQSSSLVFLFRSYFYFYTIPAIQSGELTKTSFQLKIMAPEIVKHLYWLTKTFLIITSKRGALDSLQTLTGVHKWTSVMSTPLAVIPRAPVILNTLRMVWHVKP